MLYVLCGLSQYGKTTVLEALLQQAPHFSRLVTFTTRQPLPDEIQGRDYHFLNAADFQTLLTMKRLVCPIQYRGYWYATAQADLRACVQRDALGAMAR